MTDVSGTTSYAYDSRDRMTNKVVSWTGGLTLSLNYRFDANGNLTNLYSGTSGGVTNAYQFDPQNRLTNVLANGSAAAGYSFDGAGNLLTIRYGNGVTNQIQYDVLNRMTNVVWKTNAGTLASSYYQLGLAGNRTNLSETVSGTSRTYAWTFDSLYRLKQETLGGGTSGTLSYGFDPVGNRTNRTSSVSGLTNQSFTFNTNDWVTSDSYDNNGNTTNSSGNSYQFDALNHVTNVNSGAVLMRYDGDGNRVKKTVGGTTTYYLLDDRNPSGYVQVLEEWTSIGTPTLNKVYNYGFALISQRQPGTSTNYFLFDGHCSTRILADNGGNVVNAFTFDAYGNLISSNAAPLTVYLYGGEQFDPDLGSYYLRARTYNPGIGRFPTMDEDEGDQWNPKSLHLYSYCAGDPINNLDPTGHDIESMIDAFPLAGTIAAWNMVSKLQEPRILYVRSFAPWASFGGGFQGDNRGFTTIRDKTVTSRITGVIRFRPLPLSIITATAYSDPSHHPVLGTATGTPRITATASGNKMNISMAGAIPLVPHAPDIDVNLALSVQATFNQSTYTGSLFGDAFPNAEVFVVNPNNRATMLQRFRTSGGAKTGPSEYLPGNNKRPMGAFTVRVPD